MATREQCDLELRARLRTRASVESFAKEWWSGKIATNQNWSVETFVAKNIEYILDQAERNGTLDKLGRKFDIPSDAEQRRIAISRHHSDPLPAAAGTRSAPGPAKTSSMAVKSSGAAKVFIYEQAVVKRHGIDRGVFPSIYSASPHCDAPGNVFEPTPFTGTVFPVAQGDPPGHHAGVRQV